MWDRWGRLRPNQDVAKKAYARVSGGLIKLVRAVLPTKVKTIDCLSLEKKYEQKIRGGAYLDFRMVWGNAISNKPMWRP